MVKGSRLCPIVYVRLFFNDLIVQVGDARDVLYHVVLIVCWLWQGSRVMARDPK